MASHLARSGLFLGVCALLLHVVLALPFQHTSSFTNQLASDDLDFPSGNFSVPINHFPDDEYYAPNDNGSFHLRYWYDTSKYKPGGPIIILSGGETSAEGRLVFLQKGIVALLAEATGGVGVILEHRYYGKSVPYDDLSTDHLRFLSTEQAMADIADFAKHAKYDGVDVSPDNPRILYGGSYAGGLVAFTKKKYPDVIQGAIASSGVVTAIVDFWEYFEPIRQHAPKNCSDTVVDLTAKMDHLVSLENDTLTQQLQDTFGMGGISDIRDFFYAISGVVSTWQSLNWDPAISDNTFYEFCGNLTKDQPNNLDHKFSDFTDGESWNNFGNYVDYIQKNIIPDDCKDYDVQDTSECFGTSNVTYWQQDGLDMVEQRPWWYQVCTEWGYYQGGAPKNHPSLVSKYMDVAYNQRYCNFSFGNGNLHKVPDTPNVERVNRYGGFDIALDYVAFIDGSYDPWLYATVKSPLGPKGGYRESTDLRPNYLIEGGGHHWDENGVNGTDDIKTPEFITKAHDFEIDFVKKWVEDWHDGHDHSEL